MISFLKKQIKSDLWRYGYDDSVVSFLVCYRTHKMFRFVTWFRICHYFNCINTNSKWILCKYYSRRKYKKLSILYSIDLPYRVKIGFGFKINHGMGLVVNSKTIIGNNVMVSHNVTFADEHRKAPVIGDRVRISPGTVIIGAVKVGDDVVVGANSTITKNVPNNCVAVGINKIIEKPFEDKENRFYYTL